MNLTLKQVPLNLHRRLKKQAQRNGRSLSSEALRVLENGVPPPTLEIIAEARRLNKKYGTPAITAEEAMEAIHSARR